MRARHILSWFGAGTIFGLLSSELIRQRLLPENVKDRQEHSMESATQFDGSRSPHYPPGFSLPSTGEVVVRPGFTSCLNFRTKIPDWVAERLTADRLNSREADRKNASFKSDSDIPSKFKATNEDYWDSGWSRGHLAASASHKYSQESQDSTFLLNSNILPQDLSMNGCDWNRLEVLVRDVTKAYPVGAVHVLSGPVWVPEVNTPFTQRPFSNNKVLMHEVIGKNSVYVPTHLFKIIRVDDGSGQVNASAAFIMPNRAILNEEPLESYKTNLEELEKLTGLNLAGFRSDTDLCTITRCERTGNRRMIGWRHYGYIDESRNVEELRSAVRNAVDEGFVDGDNFLIPKIIRDRMRDIKLGDEPAALFPDEPRYRQAVTNGLQIFKKQSESAPSQSSE